MLNLITTLTIYIKNVIIIWNIKDAIKSWVKSEKNFFNCWKFVNGQDGLATNKIK